ncbi:GyrI-like small molecule binding domain protein [uncultured archaeon]|nr:GyrI-like small molecule binding domain protein [uncultured archaeon]
MFEINIVEQKPMLVVGMRKRAHYQEIARIAGPPIFLWHEKSVAEAQIADQEGNADVEVCVPIAEKIPETDAIKCYELAGGKMAKIIHKGPYEASGPAYEKLFGLDQGKWKRAFRTYQGGLSERSEKDRA